VTLRLTDKIDLDVYYAADSIRYIALNPQATLIVTREVFRKCYGACPSVGFECDGVPIGGVIFDGKTAHIAVLPLYHGRWARLLRPMLEWLYGLQREILVRIEEGNVKGLAFADRCGWPRLGVRDGHVVFRLTPHGARPAARI
jgi:hypothetical protein